MHALICKYWHLSFFFASSFTAIVNNNGSSKIAEFNLKRMKWAFTAFKLSLHLHFLSAVNRMSFVKRAKKKIFFFHFLCILPFLFLNESLYAIDSVCCSEWKLNSIFILLVRLLITFVFLFFKFYKHKIELFLSYWLK